MKRLTMTQKEWDRWFWTVWVKEYESLAHPSEQWLKQCKFSDDTPTQGDK